MREISLRNDTDRAVVALVVAFALHAVIFVVVPLLPEAASPPLEAPMYVALDPVPPVEGPVDEIEPEQPSQPPETPPPATLEEDPPPEEPPVEDGLAAGDPSLAATESLDTAADAPEDSPAEAPPSPSAPSEAPEATPTPEVSPPAPPEEPRVDEVPTEAVRPAPPTFVETPPPPPPPPPQRAFSSVRGDFAAAPEGRDDSFLEGQIASIYDWQAQWQDQLSAWEERQAAQAAAQTSGETARDAATSNESDSFLARELDRLIDGIRSSSDNVVEAAAPGVARSRDSASNADDASPGDGSGITVADGGGTRSRVSGTPVQLDGVALGAGFPPEYPVSVRFSVDAAGRVFSAEVRPPTPEPELDEAILRAVRTWRFEAAASPGAPAARGTVTIIVQTR